LITNLARVKVGKEARKKKKLNVRVGGTMDQSLIIETRVRSSLWLLMSSVASRFGRETLRGLTGCKLGMQGARVLIHLLEQEGLRCSSLANAVGLEATALSHLMRSLAEQGLIHRARASGDQRGVEVSLTEKGREVAQMCRQVNVRTEELLVAGLEQGDVQNLHAILSRMSANLEANVA
jgi:DNA-binding MarR family transcriptional regulator